MSLTRREFLAALPAAAGPAAQRPNILVIICDQLNAGVLSAYGGPVATPNIDRIAHGGMVFRNATCPTPFCSPTRASLVTGQYPHTHGLVHNVMRVDYPAASGPETEQGIGNGDVTCDGLLQRAGYDTHHYGKWHLSGEKLACYPDQYGEHREYAREMKDVFDAVRQRPREEWMNWYGWILPVTVDAAYRDSFAADDPVRKAVYADFITKLGKLGLKHEEVFDVRVANRVVERIKAERGGRPFAITCSFNWPHDPNVIHAPYYDALDPAKIELPPTLAQREMRFDKDLSRQMVANRTETRLREFLRVYYASIHFLDQRVGRVLDALDATGTAKNTLVVFTSDHGDMAGNHGMAWKSTQAFYDDVARVPLMMRWPGVVKRGSTEAEVSLVDLPVTLLEAAGERAPRQMEGASLLGLLKGGSASNHRFDYRLSERVRQNPARVRTIAPDTPAEFALRGMGWKYAAYSDGEEFLYNLRRDPRETQNLAMDGQARATKQEMRRRLRQLLNDTGWRGRALS